jgi:hypothetical protein
MAEPLTHFCGRLALNTGWGFKGFAKDLSHASLLFCIGRHGHRRALNDGLRGDSRILLIKSTLDGITAVVLASSLGFGVAFSAVSICSTWEPLPWARVFGPGALGLLLDLICMDGYCSVLVSAQPDGMTRYKMPIFCLIVDTFGYNLITRLKNTW